jgi:hypothetical protein
MSFDFSVPTPSGLMTFNVKAGTSLLFVGANGGGKTRLAVFEELFIQAADSKIQTPIVMRYCRRRIDRTLKKIDFNDAVDVEELVRDYKAKTESLDVTALASLASEGIRKAIEDKNVAELLKWYDNKGVLSIACKAKDTTKPLFEQWIVRCEMRLRRRLQPQSETPYRSSSASSPLAWPSAFRRSSK